MGRTRMRGKRRGAPEISAYEAVPGAPPSGVPEGGRRAVRRWVLWPSWLLFGVLTLLFAAGLEMPLRVQYLPFAASLVLFGLPHGATDHLAVPRLSGNKPWPWPVLVVGLLYLTLGGLYLALWFALPTVAFALFIVLTWLHWGAGDLYTLRAFVYPEGPRTPLPRWRWAATALLRGGIPMLVPLVAFPDVYREVAESAVGLFGAAGIPGWLFETSLRVAAVVTLLMLTVAAFGLRGGWEGRRVDVAETALLVAFFAVVPPVLAIGLYFCLWHGLRHVARLVLLDRKAAPTLEAGRFPAALARFYRDAAPLTAAALVMLAGLYLAAPGANGSAGAVLGVYLVLISVLTLPHAVVVLFMDWRQGLWRHRTRGLG